MVKNNLLHFTDFFKIKELYLHLQELLKLQIHTIYVHIM